MDLNQNITVHNKFEFEVVDVTTGEVKQKAVAYNTVLNALLTRLMNFNAFFTHIHIGSGTGTTDATRTSLFTFKGAKAATGYASSGKFPILSRTKTITLLPEEYNGITITEVGAAYGSNSSYLCTHALLKDSEGNQISIAKTSTDQITIYATIYFNVGQQFGQLGDNANGGLLLGNNGFLTNYLLDGATDRASDASSVQVFYNNRIRGNALNNNTGYLTYLLSSSSGGGLTTYPTDKKATWTFPRLGTTVGNGAIRSISFTAGNINAGPLAELIFPMPGIWDGFNIVNEPLLGTADGTNTRFNFSYNGIKDGSAVVKANGVPVDASQLTITPTYGGMHLLLASANLGYSSGARNIAFSADSKSVVGAGSTNQASSGYGATVYSFGDHGELTGLYQNTQGTANDFTLIQPINDKYAIGVRYSKNDVLILPYDSANQSYKLNAANAVASFTVPYSTGPAVVTNDGRYVLIQVTNNSKYYLYCVRIDNPTSDTPTIVGMGIASTDFTFPNYNLNLAVSPDDKFVYGWTGFPTSPARTFVATAFDKATGKVGLTIPVPSRFNAPYGAPVTFSKDGKYMCVAGTGGGVFLYDANTGLPGQEVDTTAITAAGVSWNIIQTLNMSNNNKNVVAFYDGGSGNLVADFDEANMKLTKVRIPAACGTTWSSNSTDDFLLAKFSPDGKFIAVLTNSFMYVYPFVEGNVDQVLFNTPPAAGTVLTADYIFPGIPKTSDYVLDGSFSITFAGA